MARWDGFLGAATDLRLPLGSTILQIAVIILIPVGIGMALHHYVPQFAAPLEKWVKWLALFFLGLIIAGLLLKERANVLDFFCAGGVGDADAGGRDDGFGVRAGTGGSPRSPQCDRHHRRSGHPKWHVSDRDRQCAHVSQQSDDGDPGGDLQSADVGRGGRVCLVGAGAIGGEGVVGWQGDGVMG